MIFVALLAAAWSGFWLYASARIDGEVTAFLAREAEKGRVITCSDRRSGGFPFRIELRCADPRLEVTRDDGSFGVAASRLLAVAQIYQPNHIIVEAGGPLTVTPRDGAPRLEASWASADASIVLAGSQPDRVSLVVQGLDASEAEGDQRAPIAGGVRLEAHMRADPAAQPGTYDVVAQADAASLPVLDATLGGKAPARVEIQGVVTGIEDLSPKSIAERLREWSAAGGVLRLALARVDRAETSIKATGDVALDSEGHPTGSLLVTLSGVNELSRSLKTAGVAPPNLANLLGVGLALLGKPASIDGKPAIEVPVTLADGKARVGAFSAGATPSLF
jgi:hypothetical protein